MRSHNFANDEKPIYRQIMERIERDILTGALETDEQVMSTNEYASFFRINPATAGKALRELADKAVLYKRRGIGMFVSSGAKALLEKEHRSQFVEEMVAPLVGEANAIGMSLDEVIEAIRGVAREGRV